VKNKKLKGEKMARPKGSTSKVTVRQTKLKALLQELQPHFSDAILTAVELMKAENSEGAKIEVAPTVRLQASKLVIEKVVDLMNEAYGVDKQGNQVNRPNAEDDQDIGEVVEFKPRLSLTVAPKKD